MFLGRQTNIFIEVPSVPCIVEHPTYEIQWGPYGVRIVVLGDFHIPKNNPTISEAAMEDVAACKPDLVVPLGDFGSPGKIGTPEGLNETYGFLRAIGAPLRPILGNHDMERESGGSQRPGTMEGLFRSMFGLDEPYGVIEHPDFRFVFITTDYQPPEICFQVQECYTSDVQYEAIERIVRQRPGVPIIVFSHAPPVGCGLRTVPSVHVRATNAYLSQHHKPERWLRLAQTCPEIVLWFSAHYHLGHSHFDSVTEKFGTWFFMTGVHGTATRDGDRHSRVIDVTDDGVVVRTLCHEKRRFDDRYEWRYEGALQKMVGTRSIENIGLQLGRAQGVGYTADGSAFVPGDDRTPVVCVQRVPLVGSTPVGGGMVTLSDNRVVVVTGEGYAWEVHMDVDSVMGTLHVGEPLTAVTVSGDVLWMAEGHRLAHAFLGRTDRFVMSGRGRPPDMMLTFDEPITGLMPAGTHGVWVKTDGRAWVVEPEGTAGRPRLVRGPEHTAEPLGKVARAPSERSDRRTIALEKGLTVTLTDGVLTVTSEGRGDDIGHAVPLTSGGQVHAISPAGDLQAFFAVVTFESSSRHTEIQKWRVDERASPRVVYDVYMPKNRCPQVEVNPKSELRQSDGNTSELTVLSSPAGASNGTMVPWTVTVVWPEGGENLLELSGLRIEPGD